MLQVEGLTKYFGGVAAVDHVSFTVPEGSIYALIGPNGAGKTTVFNLITGVLPPDSGKISLKDCRLNGLNPSQIAAAGVARTFQNLQLFGSMTVLENVVTGAYLRGSMGFVRSMVRRPGISPEDRALMQYSLGLLSEVGLSDKAGWPAGRLPFGQQRLLEIARALASCPSLLLLDEPAAGLNTGETRELTGFLKRLKEKGLTIILVEHDMDTVMEVADSILVLDFGRVIFEGTPVEVQANPEVIRAYLGEEDEEC
ncbi:MAG TPA: ABC transporter ATP-binding protein [Clostridia bacterium]|jgi:branched-chain amino acid transport system ATP-binding protein|nr:ABC transporter ATP-binding protein [Clostridia bacterium]